MKFFKFDRKTNPILAAIEEGNLSVVKKYIKKESAWPSILFECIDVLNDSNCQLSLLEFSADVGQLEIVKHLLYKKLKLKDPQAIFTAKEGEGLIRNFYQYSNQYSDECWHASYKSECLDIIQTLLKDSRIDPTFDNNWALQEACKFGYVGVFETLLKDPRVKFTVKEGEVLIRNAYQFGYLDIIQILLKDNRIDPSFDNNWLLKKSYKKGNFEIFKILLKDPRVKFTAKEGEDFIREAYESEHLDIIQILLETDCIDPTFGNNWALHEACKLGYFGVVEKLLEDPRVASTANNIEVIFRIMDEKNQTIHLTIFEEMEECLSKLTLKSLALLDRLIYIPYLNLQRDNRYSALYRTCAEQIKGDVELGVELRLELRLLEKEPSHITLKQNNIERACKNIIEIANLVLSECPEQQQPFFELQERYLRYKKYDDALKMLSELIKSNLKREIENIEKQYNDTVEEKGIEIAYQEVLEITGSMEFILPELHQEWLCRLGGEYLKQHQCDAALEIFESAFNSSLKYMNKKTTSDNSKYMEISVLGMIKTFQEKIRIEGHQLKWANFTALLDKIIEKFCDVDKFQPEILSKIKTVLNPFFSNYLWATQPHYCDRKYKMELEDLSLADLVKNYREITEQKSVNQSFPFEAGLLHSYRVHSKRKATEKPSQDLSKASSRQKYSRKEGKEGKEETVESAKRKIGKK